RRHTISYGDWSSDVCSSDLLSEAVNIEIVVQDFPPVSGFTMEPALLARIAREVPRARIIKLEDPPTPLKTAQILKQAESTSVARSEERRVGKEWSCWWEGCR